MDGQQVDQWPVIVYLTGQVIAVATGHHTKSVSMGIETDQDQDQDHHTTSLDIGHNSPALHHLPETNTKQIVADIGLPHLQLTIVIVNFMAGLGALRQADQDQHGSTWVLANLLLRTSLDEVEIAMLTTLVVKVLKMVIAQGSLLTMELTQI
jgi:hypothetical protein